MYNYEFDRSSCPYLKTCPKADTEHCNHACIRYMEMDYLIQTSGLTKHQVKQRTLFANSLDVDAFKQLADIKNNIQEFVTNGDCLYIGSNHFGNGKSSWAIRLLLSYFNKVWSGNCFKVRGLFIHVPSFIVDLRNSYYTKDAVFEQLKRQIPNVDLVVWDDMGATKLSDADHTILLSLVDKRVINGKSNIYTGNFDDVELKDYLGGRLASRILSQSLVIELQGGDRR